MEEKLTTNDVIQAYRNGLFPMADSRESDVFYWYDPPMRGQLSIEELHIPERLERTVRRFPYEIKINNDFEGVIDGCAASQKGRQQTWINGSIRALFIALHQEGHAHSVEAWKDGVLVGGLYGLAVGGAFMGESMYSKARDASKICLVHLCARLKAGGFTILDTQFINDHLLQFGAFEVPKAEYLSALSSARDNNADFLQAGKDEKALLNKYLGRKK